ncbi:MAG: immunoglobulin-like domain-containing protein [Bacillota bacterium]
MTLPIKAIKSILIMLAVILLACGTAYASPDDPRGAGELGPNPVVISPGSTNPNGEYDVFVLRGDSWVKSGSLSFDRFLREKVIDLGGLTAQSEQVKIRIVQNGGGAAHIDSVFLENNPPSCVNGQQGEDFRKLLKRDYDVINVDNTDIEVEFPGGIKGRRLSVTARIEGFLVNQTPFQFPVGNLYKEISEESLFYTYRLDSQRGSVDPDGSIGEVSFREPFFKEYVRPWSGHPPGNIYGWVMNDDSNLYVTLDVTGDNTLDGDKDYAKVYVKTAGGLREFKVSVPETSWGRSFFTYTENVGYQHKVYEFSIPLAELGVSSGEDIVELPLAFSAYGTMSAGDYHPSMAYNPNDDNYLLVYQDYESSYYKICSQLVSDTGNTIGNEIDISAGSNERDYPSVVFDSTNGKYLVIWEDCRNFSDSGYDIYGQFINADGTLFDINFIISDNPGDQYNSSAAYGDDKFFIVYEDSVSGSVYGQVVDSGGTPGTAFLIGSGQNPVVAYDDFNDEFLVVWDVGASIWGQRLDSSGAPIAASFECSPAGSFQEKPALAYDNENYTFLVVWECSDRIIGVKVDHGVVLGPSSALVPVESYNPSVAYDVASDRYLLAWDDNYKTSGQFLDAAGAAVGSIFYIDDQTGDSQPVVVNNPDLSEYLVAYEGEDEDNNPAIILKRAFATDAQAVAAEKEDLTFEAIAGYNYAPDSVASDLNLYTTGKYGTSISWGSNKTAIIDIDGTVTLPASGQGDQPVTLTATLTRGVASDTVQFDLTVVEALAPGGVTRLVSVATGGTQGNNYSQHAAVSETGRYVAFTSYASDLILGDSNGQCDIFVRDRDTDGDGIFDEVGSVSTERISVSTSGSQGNGMFPSISGDGRHVAFSSDAGTLVAGDTNGTDDIFVRDRQTGKTVRVSIATDGTQGNADSRNPSISGNGRYVAFMSHASNLVSNDTNGFLDIFIHDRDSDENGILDESGKVATMRVSVATGGAEANYDSYFPSISSSGRHVTFSTGADNLVAGDTNSDSDIFVHDRDADGDGVFDSGKTFRANISSGGAQSSEGALSPDISGDGRFVVFYAPDTDLVSGDNNGFVDVYLHDRDTDQNGIFDESGNISTYRVSQAYDGGQPNYSCYAPRISSDGRFISFFSSAGNLVRGDGNGTDDIFVYDRLTGDIQIASIAENGVQGNDYSVEPDISGDGKWVAFRSGANNLVMSDTNYQCDIFAHEVQISSSFSKPQASQWNPAGTGMTYTVTIPAGAVKDSAGNSLSGDYTFTFTTQGP